MPYGEFLIRLVLAALLGGAIGLEREIHGRPAGIRTYLILSLGTALLMVLSEYLLVAYHDKFPGLAQGDPGRIAGQAITGIGFLGAGVIIKSGEVVRGLTTAACLWMVAGIGMAVGIGLYLPALIVTAVAMFNLVFLKQIERLVKKDRFYNLEIDSKDADNMQEELMHVLSQKEFHVVDVGIEKDAASGVSRYQYIISTNRRWDPDAIVGMLLKLPGTYRVRFQ